MKSWSLAQLYFVGMGDYEEDAEMEARIVTEQTGRRWLGADVT